MISEEEKRRDIYFEIINEANEALGLQQGLLFSDNKKDLFLPSC